MTLPNRCPEQLKQLALNVIINQLQHSGPEQFQCSYLIARQGSHMSSKTFQRLMLILHKLSY